MEAIPSSTLAMAFVPLSAFVPPVARAICRLRRLTRIRILAVVVASAAPAHRLPSLAEFVARLAEFVVLFGQTRSVIPPT